MFKVMQLVTILTLASTTACTSTPGVTVVERADSLSSRPDWVSETNATREENGKLYFLQSVEVEGDSSKGAALNMADEKAMSEPFRALTDEFLDQNQVGEKLRKDASVGQRVISATRGYRPPMANMKVVHRYWEVVRVPNQSDPEVTSVELRVFAQVEVSKADYESAKKAYFAHLNGEPAVKKILDDVGAKQRDAVMSH